LRRVRALIAAGATGAAAGVSTVSSTTGLVVFIDFIVRTGTGRIAWDLYPVLRQLVDLLF
jgi:hypothetical protein